MSKSRKHIKRRNTSKKKTFKISTPSGVSIIKALDAQCALIKAYKAARKRIKNSWDYKWALKMKLKLPELPSLNKFKLTF